MELELPEIYDFMRRIFRGKVYPKTGITRYCPTGEEYWTVTPGGIKPEGSAAELFDSPLEACNLYRKTVFEMLDMFSVSHTLYFRKRPCLLKADHDWDGEIKPYKYTVYSRFLISDKPVIEDFEKFLEEKRKCAGATF